MVVRANRGAALGADLGAICQAVPEDGMRLPLESHPASANLVTGLRTGRLMLDAEKDLGAFRAGQLQEAAT